MDGQRRLERLVARSPLLSAMIAGWEQVVLPDCYLVAGAIAQSAWNDAFGFDMAHGITDIDLIYYDPTDLSAQAEAAHASRVRESFAHLPVWIDVKNEARVHLWYEAKFGYPIMPAAQSEADHPDNLRGKGHPLVGALAGLDRHAVGRGLAGAYWSRPSRPAFGPPQASRR